jgi:poly(3-hydroxybutyrate) depolymerase
MILSLLLACLALANDPLPKLSIDGQRITVSGISSGGFFATQMQVAFSSLVRGSAIVAGGAYGCSLGQEKRTSLCMGKAEKVELEALWQQTQEQEKQGNIDPLSNLQKARVVLFFGAKDVVVKKSQAILMESFYSRFLLKENLLSILHPEANHAFPTEGFGNPCKKLGLPWISDCQLNFVETFMKHLDGPIPAKAVTVGSWRKFDQTSLQDDRQLTGLAEWGALYIPKACETGSCGLHLAFHGCQMNDHYVQDQFIKNVGYLEMAEQRKIVVIFPQLEKTKENPNTCWDWIGSTGPDYLNKNGPQMKAMRKLIQSVSGI